MALPGKPPAEEREPVYRGLAAIVLPAVAAMAKLRIRGHEHVPAKGAFVLSPNHYSEIDPIIMAVAIYRSGRIPRFMAKASLFEIPVIGRILTAAGQIPVERAGRSSHGEPMEAARRIVRDELGVIVYPEGSLTRDPALWPMRGKTGAVRMALEAGIPLIPAAHWGTQHLMPRYGKAIHPFPRKRIDITIKGFSLFAENKPASVRLHLHMGMEDAGWNVPVLAERHGISDRLVVSSMQHQPQSVSLADLNTIYNAAAVGLNTSTGAVTNPKTKSD